MRGEDRVWVTVVVATAACVLGVFVALTVADFNVTRFKLDEEARRTQVSEVDADLQGIGESIGRLEQGINVLQIEVLRSHVLVLERSLERCGCCCEVDDEFVPVGRAGDNEDPNRWSVPNEEVD
jgi:hypothetical protein